MLFKCRNDTNNLNNNITLTQQRKLNFAIPGKDKDCHKQGFI
jgi:hypothetical protein